MAVSITRSLLASLCAASFAGQSFAADAATPRDVTPEYRIVTAPEGSAYFQIGRDIARVIAPPAGVRLEVLASSGSAENVRRLRYEPGVVLAIVQSDVGQAFADQAAAGNADADEVIRRLRVIVPLQEEEIYFIVRADSPLDYVDDIRGAKINTGPPGSESALTAATLYRSMFDEPLPEGNVSRLSNEEALVKLVTDRSVDVVVLVAAQPAKLLTAMKPASRQYIKFLWFDRNHPTASAALATYFPATVRASSYPELLARDFPTLAVRAYLVTDDPGQGSAGTDVARVARALCQYRFLLEAGGRFDWRQVDFSLPELARGWRYYGPAASEIRACAAARRNPP